MEGNQVGGPSGASLNNNSNTGYTNFALTEDHATGASSISDTLSLLWPSRLIEEIKVRHKPHFWSTPIAVISFILAMIMGLALGPAQLIVLILSEDLNFTESYYNIALRISLLLSGVVAALVIAAMILIWREQPRRAIFSTVIAGGALAVDALVWFVAFVLPIPSHLLTSFFVIIIVGIIILAGTLFHRSITDEKMQKGLYTSLAIVGIVGAVELCFTGGYIMTQSHVATEAEAEIVALGEAQAAARIDGISAGLSDLIFTLCSGPYDAVYLPTEHKQTGIFECRESHVVYTVGGPTDPLTDTSTVVLGSAFYFGTTSDEIISKYWPTDTGTKYLYRNLGSDDDGKTQGELVLLTPASTEEVLVNALIDPILGYLSERPNENLTLSVFYNNELNNVLSTRDYILISAKNTISLTSFLPRGTNLRGYLNGRMGAFIYTADLQLGALSELGASPLLYSSQTREALNGNRHIKLTLEAGRQYDADELRELLYGNFFNPENGETEE